MDNISNIKNYQKILVVGVCSLLIFTVYFYRDPDRAIPSNSNICVSPSDGTVLYINNYDEFPKIYKDGNSYILKNIAKYYSNGSYVVGTFMSPFDVHVIRAPVGGTVVYKKHVEGGFYPAFMENLSKKNEYNILIIKNGSDYIGVVQIAGVLARRTTYYVDVGDNITMGQRIGMIKLGSQTALILPKDKYILTVKEGDRVYGGQSIIAKRINN